MVYSLWCKLPYIEHIMAAYHKEKNILGVCVIGTSCMQKMAAYHKEKFNVRPEKMLGSSGIRTRDLLHVCVRAEKC